MVCDVLIERVRERKTGKEKERGKSGIEKERRKRHKERER